MKTLPFPPARVVIGAVALLFLLLRCSFPRAPAPVISRTVSGVDGFELRHDGYHDGLQYSGHFSLGYAIWANYPFVVYRSREYRRAGPGSVFVRPAQGLHPRYVVSEAPVDPEPNLGYSISGLEIGDRWTGEVLGYRTLRRGQEENGHGWTGQHAAEFVRRVLQTSAPVGGPVGTKPYGNAVATFDILGDGDVPPAEETDNGCPSTYRLDRKQPQTGLDTGAWVFVPQHHVDSYACDGNYILVQTGYGNLLDLDLLTTDGRHVFQTELHTPVDQVATITLRRLRLSKTTSGNIDLQVDIVYGAASDRLGKPVPARQVRATVQTGLNFHHDSNRSTSAYSTSRSAAAPASPSSSSMR